MRIVGLGGSLRQPSASLAALEVALAAAAGHGASTRLIDLRRLDLPLYVPGAEAPTAAQQLAETAADADAMIWSSPLYHDSCPVRSRTRSTGCSCSPEPTRRTSRTRWWGSSPSPAAFRACKR